MTWNNQVLDIYVQGNCMHTSIGSTSWAMMTSWAFLLSTREVTVFTPKKEKEILIKRGLIKSIIWGRRLFTWPMLRVKKLVCLHPHRVFSWRNSKHHCIGYRIAQLICTTLLLIIFTPQFIWLRISFFAHQHGAQGASWWGHLPFQLPSAQRGPAASASSPAWSLACTCGPVWTAVWLHERGHYRLSATTNCSYIDVINDMILMF